MSYDGTVTIDSGYYLEVDVQINFDRPTATGIIILSFFTIFVFLQLSDYKLKTLHCYLKVA